MRERYASCWICGHEEPIEELDIIEECGNCSEFVCQACGEWRSGEFLCQDCADTEEEG